MAAEAILLQMSKQTLLLTTTFLFHISSDHDLLIASLAPAKEIKQHIISLLDTQA
jgi:uncharacterized protein VirK/YbjX